MFGHVVNREENIADFGLNRVGALESGTHAPPNFSESIALGV